MKKLILSLIAVAVGTLGSFAQDDLVATLSHGTNLSTFTGEDALAQAYKAAAEGDVITLSPGVFVGVNMEKAITIRGAGYKPMASNGYVSTQITGEMTINIPSDATSAFEMEGVDFMNRINIYGDKLMSVRLSKSFFRSLVSTNGISMKATSCIFASELDAEADGKNTTLNCFNCVIGGAWSRGLSGTKIGKIVATNCVVVPYDSALPYSIFINSIIISNYQINSSLPETCTAQNCIGINSRNSPDVFQNIPNPANMMVEGAGGDAYANVFKTFKSFGSMTLYETYELTDAAAAKYLGDDGTQVGIYGGANPFNPSPTNPKVKKFTVNSNASNGKLNVKINVE